MQAAPVGVLYQVAFCATAPFESAVISLLSGEHQTASTLHNLTLLSSRGAVLLQR